MPVKSHGLFLFVKARNAYLAWQTKNDMFSNQKTWKWAIVILAGLLVWSFPLPDGVKPGDWIILSVFIATIAGLILHPLPIGAMVLLGLLTMVFAGAIPIETALKGFGNHTVWLVLAACMMVRAMITTGLGKRIALLFVRYLGQYSIGLSYALVFTDFLLAGVIPSNGARMGGIIFPVASSLAQTMDSYPGNSARRLGAYLMFVIYQCGVVSCAMFITGQASNLLIAGFIKSELHIQITYGSWLLYSVLPGLICLATIPLILYKLYPPEIKQTPAAAAFASAQLTEMGPAKKGEWILMGVLIMLAGLWIGGTFLKIDPSTVALLGICILLLTGVLQWDDILGEKPAWDVFFWYGGLIAMAGALNDSGLTKLFASYAASMTHGWSWLAALILLLLVYFYTHYGFASITAHATAMFTPFALVALATGAPVYLVILPLMYFSNLNAGLTHYGTTPAPIYFGSGYISQSDWWRLGFILSIYNILVWALFGAMWWHLLGLW